jgi:hypothetical protein
MYKVPRHIWRTTDGRLVPHGHADAAFLAYPAGEELSDHDAKAKGVLAVYPDEKKTTAKKAVAKPADKAMAKPADKAATTQDSDTKEQQP